jgi:hypothetical protein
MQNHLAAPQGFEPRYADPELMDCMGENSWLHTDYSITYHQLKPARKHFDVVLKRLDLAQIGSRRTAHLRHTSIARWNWLGELIVDHPSISACTVRRST